jgi:hypothetical protein
LTFPTGWKYREAFVLDNTTTNGGGVFALANFQAVLLLTSSNFSAGFSAANSNGSDIVVSSDAAGSDMMDFWLVSYNQGTSTGQINVLIPSQAIGVISTVYVWYGNSSQTASLGTYSGTMTKLVSGSGITELYHCDDGTGSSLAEAGGGTAATVVNGPPTWEAVDGGLGLTGGSIQYITPAAPGFSKTGSGWTYYTAGSGYGQSTYYTSSAGSGANTATWTITGLPPGTYNVSTSWIGSAGHATNTPFTVSDSGTLLTTVAVNQVPAPSGITDAGGFTWQVLDSAAVINSGTCVVEMTDNSNDGVIAGSVRIAPTLCNAPFSGAAITLNGTNQCITIPGFTGVALPASGSIGFWFRNLNVVMPINTCLLSFFANATGGTSSIPGNGFSIEYSSSALHLYTWVGGTATLTSGAAITLPAEWTYFEYCWSPAQRDLFINGAIYLAQITNQSGSVGLCQGESAVNSMTIGAIYQHDSGQTPFYSTTPTNCFWGTIDEIVVRNHQPLLEEILATYNRRTYATGMKQDGRWTRQGQIVSTIPWGGGSRIIEPCPLYLSSGSQVLAVTGSPSGENSIGILTATDGGLDSSSWSNVAGNPTVSGGHGSQFYEDVYDGVTTFYWFYSDGSTTYYQTSSTGAAGSWGSSASTGITVSGIDQSWASSSLWSQMIFRDANDSTWKCLQGGYNGTQYQTGLLTSGQTSFSSAISNWTAYSGNPLTTLAVASGAEASIGCVLQNLAGSGIYSIWYHITLSSSVVLPTMLCYSTSTNLETWTTPYLLMRPGPDTFSSGTVGADQVADARVAQMGSTAALYYDTDAELTAYGAVNVATYPGTLANVLVDPPVISANVQSYSVSGPSSGTAGQASTNFTVTLGGTFAANDTITISLSGTAGGSTSTASLSLTSLSSSATFTYTPATAGTETITLTSGSSYTVTGSPLTYTSTPTPTPTPTSTFTRAWYPLSAQSWVTDTASPWVNGSTQTWTSQSWVNASLSPWVNNTQASWTR